MLAKFLNIVGRIVKLDQKMAGQPYLCCYQGIEAAFSYQRLFSRLYQLHSKWLMLSFETFDKLQRTFVIRYLPED